MPTLKTIARRLLTLAMVSVGIAHFTHEPLFTGIVPPWLPAPRMLVWVSGVFEILGGLGLEPEKTRSAAGWGLIALYVAVFPANIHMAVNDVPMGGEPVEPAILWARLPFQFAFIGWAYWCSRPDGQR